MTKITITESQLATIIRDAVQSDKAILSEYYDKVGLVGNKDKLEIIVYTNDPGYIPHFHVIDAATRGKKIDTCVEIMRNHYFFHGCHTSTLNSKQQKALYEFMSSENEDGKTNFLRTVELWNKNNSKVLVPTNITMPNYKNIV